MNTTLSPSRLPSRYSLPALVLCWLLSVLGLTAAGQTTVEVPDIPIKPTGNSSSHKLILCTDGSVKGWGENTYGQLGNNAGYVATPVVVAVGLPTRVVQVAITNDASFAILANGTLWAWGNNAKGQLGVGSGTTTTATAMQVPTLANVVAVSGGYFHTIALCADGTVWSWGDRSVGALGTGSGGVAIQYVPQRITTLANIRAIASGDQFALALDANGHIWSWGINATGELGLGLPTGTTRQATPAQIQLNNVRQIEATNVRAAAVLTNGTVYNWGQNAWGLLGLGHTNYINTPTQVGAGTITDAVAVAINNGSSIAVRPTGATYVWGSNVNGGFGMTSPSFAAFPIPGPVFSPNVQISGQSSQFTSIERTGTVKTWGGEPLGYTPTSPMPQWGSYTPTTPAGLCPAVPAAAFPACGPQRAYYQNAAATYVAAQHGYTVSPAEIGTYGTTTYLNAQLAPYYGTVVFDGIYHLRGDVQVTGGTFRLMENTVFYIDSDNGLGQMAQAPNYGATAFRVQQATLELRAATLRASCPDRWGGVVLLGGAQLSTQSGGIKGALRAGIRDARTGVYSYTPNWQQANTNTYFLVGTDFINNDIGLYDLAKGTAQLREGARACTFRDGRIGIQFESVDYSSTTRYGGNYDAAVFERNTFDNLEYGLYGQAGAVHVAYNTFSNTYLAAISLEATSAGTGDIKGNTVIVPAAWPAALLAQFPAGTPQTAYGINVIGTADVVENQVQGALPTAHPVQQVGMNISSNGRVAGNYFHALDQGLRVQTSDNFNGSNHTITSNSFTQNTTGLLFTGFHLNGSPTAPVQLALRCNTFSSTRPGSVGVWVKAGTPFPAALGSASMPNGNRFDGIADATKRFVYDIRQPIGSTAFAYYRYDSPQERFTGLSDNNFYDYSSGPVSSSIAIAVNTQLAGTNACGGSTTPGVYARSTAKAPAIGSTNSAASLSGAYPNPATETVAFSYSLPSNGSPAYLVLRDLLGREVVQQPLFKQAGEVQVSVQHLPAGFYTSTLETAGHRLFSQKVTVTH